MNDYQRIIETIRCQAPFCDGYGSSMDWDGEKYLPCGECRGSGINIDCNYKIIGDVIRIEHPGTP